MFTSLDWNKCFKLKWIEFDKMGEWINHWLISAGSFTQYFVKKSNLKKKSAVFFSWQIYHSAP